MAPLSLWRPGQFSKLPVPQAGPDAQYEKNSVKKAGKLACSVTAGFWVGHVTICSHPVLGQRKRDQRGCSNLSNFTTNHKQKVAKNTWLYILIAIFAQ